MITKIIQIGNSKGIRIPATILKECKIEDQVELLVEKNTIIIKHKKSCREGWDKQFKGMHQNNDDQLLDDDMGEEMEDWEWK